MKTGPAEVAVEDEGSFTLVVTNSVNQADDVTLSDTLPSGLPPTGADAECTIVDQTVTCDLGSLSAGESELVTIDFAADSEGTFVNTACVSTSDSETDTINSCDDHTIAVEALIRRSGLRGRSG